MNTTHREEVWLSPSELLPGVDRVWSKVVSHYSLMSLGVVPIRDGNGELLIGE